MWNNILIFVKAKYWYRSYQQWKKKLVEGASEVFLTKAERKAENKPYTEDDLMKKIGRLEVEIDFLRRVSLACGLNPEKRK